MDHLPCLILVYVLLHSIWCLICLYANGCSRYSIMWTPGGRTTFVHSIEVSSLVRLIVAVGHLIGMLYREALG